MDIFCGQANPFEVFSLILSVLAVAAALYSLSHAGKANRIAAMSAWSATLMRYLEDELKSLAHDAEVFQQVCTVPFATVERKRSVTSALNQSRDESRRRMHNLSLLSPGVEELIKLRDVRDEVSDSYFDNCELTLPKEKADQLLARYESAAKSYTAALRRYLFEISRAAVEPPK